MSPSTQLPSRPAGESLLPGAKLLAPILTPLRNRIPRIIIEPTNRSIEFTMLVGGAQEGYPQVHFELPTRIQSLYQRIFHEELANAPSGVNVLAQSTADMLRALMISEEEHILHAASAQPVCSVPDFIPLNAIGGHPERGLELHLDGYNGVFAQLAMVGSRATIRVMKPGNALASLVNLVLDMVELKGATPTTVYAPSHFLQELTTALLRSSTPYCADPSGARVTRLSGELALALDGQMHRLANFMARGGKFPLLELVVHPLLMSDVLVIQNDLPADDTVRRLVPAPWSMALAYDYTLYEYPPTGQHIDQEVRVAGALRVHTPYLFGWLQKAQLGA